MNKKYLYEIARDFYINLTTVIKSIRVTDREQHQIDFYKGIEIVSNLITSQRDHRHKLMFIGNGASASISSHMSADFCKNGGIKAINFNDSSLITSISNDYGYKHVFEKPIEMFANSDDVLFAISSSGRSENILNGVKIARLKGCKIITLSGFDDDNPLAYLGDFNFYVPDRTYGSVEVIHHSICHCILDTIIRTRNG